LTVVSKKQRSVLTSVLSGRSDANISFAELLTLLETLGFSQRIKGDHHILWREGVVDMINLQPKDRKPSLIK
jgi:hypothetical protein